MPANQLLGVELARVGTWDLAIGGTRTFTAEDFADAIAASHDPDYGIMAIRPGHTDPRFDGEPALGRVVNMRMAGDRLVGDLVDLPPWLMQPRGEGAVIHAAFPERSVEGYTNMTSPSGRKYRLVLTGLALLGVAPPAMQGLADLPAAVAAGAVRIAASSAVMDLADAPLSESEPPSTETVTVSGDDLHVHSEGSLMDPTVIRTALGLAADATDEQVTEALAAQATALTEAQAAAEAARARVSELEAVAAANATPPAGDAPTPTAPEGFTIISEAVLADLQANAAQGVAAAQTLATQAADAFIGRYRNRIGASSNPRSQVVEATMRREWSRNPAEAEQFAAALPVVAITHELGHESGAEGSEANDPMWDDFERNLSPDVAATRAARTQGRS